MARNSYFRLARWFGAVMAIFFVSIITVLILKSPVLLVDKSAESNLREEEIPPASIPPAPASELEPELKRPQSPSKPLSEPAGTDLAAYAFLVSAGGFFVSLVGTASTIILGWRADRRQQRELASKLTAAKHSNDT
jgi:hypothetical protein